MLAACTSKLIEGVESVRRDRCCGGGFILTSMCQPFRYFFLCSFELGGFILSTFHLKSAMTTGRVLHDTESEGVLTSHKQ